MLAYEALREKSLDICAPLEPEDHVVQPHPYVSPPKWHLGHTTWFFETFCLRAHFEMDPIDPRFHYVFNSYYDSQGERVAQDQRGTLSRPTLQEVLQYRLQVDGRIREAQDMIESSHSEKHQSWRAAMELGLQHEQQHQELLYMDIKAILYTQPGRPAYHPAEAFAEAKRLDDHEVWDKFASGLHTIGATSREFAFDNERPQHQVHVPDFSLRRGLVSNSEFCAFIEDGGYTRPELWLADGWTWVKENKIQAPLYWERHASGWREYTFGGEVELQPNAPVTHVSYYEADAYARWAGVRSPTEAEWEVARATLPADEVWNWTASAYAPYPGFKPFAGAFGEYNGKFMSGQMVLRGGCRYTPEDHYRPTYRNFYKPEMRWQFAGIRLCR